MPWKAVASKEDLPPGGRYVSEVDGKEILLLDYEGEILAVGNRCPHMKTKMERGELTEDGAIVCPRHHSVFDLETGAVREWVPWPPVVGRALGAVSSEKPLPVYTTKVEDGNIWVELEESV